MLNNLCICGRLTKDGELTQYQSGVFNWRGSIAVDRPVKKDQPKQTDFFNVVAWGNTANFINTYFKKGDFIIINGRLQLDKWTDKDGNKRQSVTIVINTAGFGGYKRQDESQGEAAPDSVNDFMNIPDGIDEELPFN